MEGIWTQRSFWLQKYLQAAYSHINSEGNSDRRNMRNGQPVLRLLFRVQFGNRSYETVSKCSRAAIQMPFALGIYGYGAISESWQPFNIQMRKPLLANVKQLTNADLHELKLHFFFAES